MTRGLGQPWSGLEVVWCEGCDVPRYDAGMRVCVWCGAVRERVFFVWRRVWSPADQPVYILSDALLSPCMCLEMCTYVRRPPARHLTSRSGTSCKGGT